MANTKEFNISSNAVTVLNQTADAAENTAKGFTSAKAELRALQQQLLTMDQSSEEFKKASARAAELKDNISDLSAEISANAGNAFEGLSNNVSLFGSRLMDLDLKGAGQALTGMGAAVNKIDFKTLKEEIGGLVKGLGKLAKAVISNPYIMLAAAIALIIANFDTIIKQFPAIEKGLTGINEQERELLDLQTKRAEQAKKNYDNISATENTLKLQGKTEKEIRDMKIAAIQAAIQEAKVRLETQRGQEKSQIETAQRNREILEGMIRWINAPLYLLLSTVDKIASWVGQTTNLAEGLTNLAADLLIDPEQQQADLKKSFEEQENTIRDMENSLAGFRLEQQKADKDAADKAAKDAEEERKNYEKSQQELTDILAKWEQERIDIQEKAKEDYIHANQSAQANELYDLEQKKNKELELFEGTNEEKVLILETYRILEENINKKYDDLALQQQQEANEKLKAADEKAKEEAKKREEDLAKAKLDAEKQLYEARWGLATASVDLLGTLFAKNKKAADVAFALDKGLAVAKIIVDTQAEIAGYYAANAAGGPAGMAVASAQALAAKIRAATSIATIAGTTVAKFMNGGSPSAGGGGGTAGSSTGGTQAPSPANFAFLQNQPNQIQPPLQAYVVSGQVSSNLELQQLINNQSRLGG